MLIAGNWKMHKGPGETAGFCPAWSTDRRRGMRMKLAGVDIVVDAGLRLPPRGRRGSGGQRDPRCAKRPLGQGGGLHREVSRSMLIASVSPAPSWALRAPGDFGETDETAALAAAAALEAGLDVIVRVGETLDEREARRDRGRPPADRSGRAPRHPERRRIA